MTNGRKHMQFKPPDGFKGQFLSCYHFLFDFNLDIRALHNFNLAKKQRFYGRQKVLQINAI